MAPKARYAAATSAIDPPARVGGCPGIPVRPMRPPIPWAIEL